MNISNVCKMLAPNLLRQPASKEIDISLISCTNTAIESIADNYEKIFEAPVWIFFIYFLFLFFIFLFVILFLFTYFLLLKFIFILKLIYFY